MSGHSKWNNIKRKKGAADAQRGAVFTKIGREIQVAVKNGGADPEVNSRLKDVIAKAKAANMPNDNIQRSITKAAGAADSDNFEEITYEGYGPGGVAVMVRTLSDNRNRTAGDLRHIFDKFGGNLGTTGCVGFLFQDKGTLIIERDGAPDEETMMLAALEAGAEDFAAEDEAYEITTEPDQYDAVRSALEQQGFVFLDVSLGPVPVTWTALTDPDMTVKMEKLIEKLEEHDDVQEVYHNWEQG
ncbi:MAG: YebC/PmpR family DNA-binding transcriptional regulator [Clostridiaceae bacterium]|jgi:YebC/PmpR family DNA-binding regulatory protein|nr:YebC/PmpR family DNA-binding transcriptional regulator [Eubacteriales bacterium]NLB43756.1 YebC/PmpR family DNA-binding transcriptional regulator [Clostridiaceae bacterium]